MRGDGFFLVLKVSVTCVSGGGQRSWVRGRQGATWFCVRSHIGAFIGSFKRGGGVEQRSALTCTFLLDDVTCVQVITTLSF